MSNIIEEETDNIEIIFDVETTGLKTNIDRIVEIGCLKIKNFKIVDQYHQYINPECVISDEVIKIHNITNEFVKGKPVFKDIADDFLKFIGDYNLVAHNGFFDLGFINAELNRLGYNKIANERLIDTLSLARQKFPGLRNRLDDLCERYNIDKGARIYHGALLDSELLLKVYVELCDAKQANLGLNCNKEIEARSLEELIGQINNRGNIKYNEEILLEHKRFISEKIGEHALWKEYFDE